VGAVPCYGEDMGALREPVSTRMSVDEFLAWRPDKRDVRGWQLIDGEPVAMAPNSDSHGALHAEIAALIGNHLVARNSPCRVLTEPGVVPRVRSDRNYRMPDLAVTCAPPALGQMISDPMLAVEILSPSNETQTRANIWAYTTLPSMQEIVALHSTRIEAELLRRGPDGTWPERPEVLTAGDTLALPSIAFAAPLSALYRTTVLATR
jgi:Uma2 family endonuclease